MKNTSLCYIEQDGAYLMMHRVKKENDINREKWVGIGGKFESGETPTECAVREIKEETGVTPKNLRYRGLVTFVSKEYGTEYMHLFTASGYDGKITNTVESCAFKNPDNSIAMVLTNRTEMDIFYKMQSEDGPVVKIPAKSIQTLLIEL